MHALEQLAHVRIDHYTQSQLILISPDRLGQYWEVKLSTYIRICSMLIIDIGFGSHLFLLESSNRRFSYLNWPQGRNWAKSEKQTQKSP